MFWTASDQRVLRFLSSLVVVVVVLLFDIVHEKTKEHKSITVQKDVKEHRITVRFSSQGATMQIYLNKCTLNRNSLYSFLNRLKDLHFNFLLI